MTKLEEAFCDAFCTEEVPIDVTVLCQCGQSYTRREGDPPLMHGAISGMSVVRGCQCPAASNAGNMIWGNRHPIAVFLRRMAETLRDDTNRLLDALPDPEPTGGKAA